MLNRNTCSNNADNLTSALHSSLFKKYTLKENQKELASYLDYLVTLVLKVHEF